MKMRNVLFLLQVISVSQNFISFSDTTSLNEGARSRSRKIYSRWTPEMQTALIEICRNIPLNEPYYFDKVRKRWHESYPCYNVSDGTLYRKMYQIPEEITGRAKRPKSNFKWDAEKNNELIDIYLNTHPYNESHPVGIHEEWERRHPDFPKFRKTYLTTHARKYLDRCSQHAVGETSQRSFEWTDKQDSDLYHIHHVTLPEGRKQSVNMHKIWADLHPDHRDLTYDQLTERVKYLQRNLPDEHFPWTKEQNKELMEIYHNTSPGVADQGQRIYEIWSKIHPRYNFMTPYYLQVHASTLAKGEKTMIDGKKTVTKLTDEQKESLVDIYRRLTKPNKLLYNFHRAWVQEYPALAHLTAHNLVNRAKRLTSKAGSFNAGVAEGEKVSKNIQFQHRKYQKYTPEEKAELQTLYRLTYPREHKHGNRLLNEYAKKQKSPPIVKGSSLKRLIRNWIEKDLDGKGKAPMVVPKIESGSEPSPSTSTSSK